MPFFTSANALENLAAHWAVRQPEAAQSMSDALKPDLGIACLKLHDAPLIVFLC